MTAPSPQVECGRRSLQTAAAPRAPTKHSGSGSAADLCSRSAGYRTSNSERTLKALLAPGSLDGNSLSGPAPGTTCAAVHDTSRAPWIRRRKFFEGSYEYSISRSVLRWRSLSLFARPGSFSRASTQPVDAQQRSHQQGKITRRVTRAPRPPRRFSARGPRQPAHRKMPTSSTPTSSRCRTGDDGARTTSSGR